MTRKRGSGESVLIAVLIGVACACQSGGRPQTALAASEAPKGIRDLGAVGDGAADDTDALQRAVDSGLGDIRLPRGQYRLTKTIVINLDRVGYTSIVGDGTATLIMAGEGPALRFIGTHGGTADPKTVKSNVWQRQRTPLADGFEIRGEHPKAQGIVAEGTMQAVFSRLLIRGVSDGIVLTRRNRNVIISECHVYHNRGVGVLLDQVNLHQISISNSHISYNGGGGVVVRRSEVRNLQIGTCDIEGNMDPDGPPTANVLLDAREGTIREGAIVGSTLQHTHEAPGSANIRFVGRGPDEPQKIGHFSISDNALSDVAVNVHLKYVRGVSIMGNSFWKGFEHNLLVEGSSNIVVGPNVFDRNPDYRPYDSRNSLLFVDSEDCTLNGLHINHVKGAEAALTLRRCRRFNLTNSMVLNFETVGLLLDDVQDVRVSDCVIRDDRPESKDPIAIRVTGGRGNTIVDNLLAGTIEVAAGSAHLEGNLVTAGAIGRRDQRAVE